MAQSSLTPRLLWLRATQHQLQKNPLNFIDSPMALPGSKQGLFAQASWRFQRGPSQWILRPSLETRAQTNLDSPSYQETSQTKVELRLNEFYWHHQLNEQSLIAVGLQNFQWGPGELLSPSNPIFHLMIDSQDPTFQMRGRSLLRFNYSPTENFSFITMAEVFRNEEREFIYDQAFYPKVLFKAETILSEATNYIGVTFGREQLGDPFIGAYANHTFNQTFSLYFDWKTTQVSKRYGPQMSPALGPTIELQNYDGQNYALGLMGVRLELEHLDLRYEIVENQLAFSESEIQTAALAMQINPSQQSLQQARFLNNGRELPSRQYRYFSLRLTRLVHWLDSTISIRHLLAHVDQSDQTTLQWDGTWGDHWNFFLMSTSSSPKDRGELSLLFKSRINGGLKYTW